MHEARKSHIHCNDTYLEISIQPRLYAGELLDIVCSHYNIKAKEYFGICYIHENDTTQIYWLQMDKYVLSHEYLYNMTIADKEKSKNYSSENYVSSEKTANTLNLHFKIRFYPYTIMHIPDYRSIEMFYTQNRHSLLTGNLIITNTSNAKAILALLCHIECLTNPESKKFSKCNRTSKDNTSIISQDMLESEFCMLENTLKQLTNVLNSSKNQNYGVKDSLAILVSRYSTQINENNFIGDQSLIHEIINKYGRKFVELSRGQAIIEFLKRLEKTPTYGIHYYAIKDKHNVRYWMGIGYNGFIQTLPNDPTHILCTYEWGQIVNLYFKDRKFCMEIRDRIITSDGGSSFINNSVTENALLSMTTITVNSNGEEIRVLSWYMESSHLAATLWSLAVQMHHFYNEHRDDKVDIDKFNAIITSLDLNTTSHAGNIISKPKTINDHRNVLNEDDETQAYGITKPKNSTDNVSIESDGKFKLVDENQNDVLLSLTSARDKLLYKRGLLLAELEEKKAYLCQLHDQETELLNVLYPSESVICNQENPLLSKDLTHVSKLTTTSSCNQLYPHNNNNMVTINTFASTNSNQQSLTSKRSLRHKFTQTLGRRRKSEPRLSIVPSLVLPPNESHNMDITINHNNNNYITKETKFGKEGMLLTANQFSFSPSLLKTPIALNVLNNSTTNGATPHTTFDSTTHFAWNDAEALSKDFILTASNVINGQNAIDLQDSCLQETINRLCAQVQEFRLQREVQIKICKAALALSQEKGLNRNVRKMRRQAYEDACNKLTNIEANLNQVSNALALHQNLLIDSSTNDLISSPLYLNSPNLLFHKNVHNDGNNLKSSTKYSLLKKYSSSTLFKASAPLTTSRSNFFNDETRESDRNITKNVSKTSLAKSCVDGNHQNEQIKDGFINSAINYSNNIFSTLRRVASKKINNRDSKIDDTPTFGVTDRQTKTNKQTDIDTSSNQNNCNRILVSNDVLNDKLKHHSAIYNDDISINPLKTKNTLSSIDPRHRKVITKSLSDINKQDNTKAIDLGNRIQNHKIKPKLKRLGLPLTRENSELNNTSNIHFQRQLNNLVEEKPFNYPNCGGNEIDSYYQYQPNTPHTAYYSTISSYSSTFSFNSNSNSNKTTGGQSSSEMVSITINNNEKYKNNDAHKTGETINYTSDNQMQNMHTRLSTLFLLPTDTKNMFDHNSSILNNLCTSGRRSFTPSALHDKTLTYGPESPLVTKLNTTALSDIPTPSITATAKHRHNKTNASLKTRPSPLNAALPTLETAILQSDNFICQTQQTYIDINNHNKRMISNGAKLPRKCDQESNKGVSKQQSVKEKSPSLIYIDANYEDIVPNKNMAKPEPIYHNYEEIDIDSKDNSSRGNETREFIGDTLSNLNITAKKCQNSEDGDNEPIMFEVEINSRKQLNMKQSVSKDSGIGGSLMNVLLK